MSTGIDHASGYKRKLIEVSLPLEDINKEAAREKAIRHACAQLSAAKLYQ